MDLSVLITTPALIFTRTLEAASDYAQLSYLNFEPAKIFVRTLISNIQYTELSHVSFSDANIFNRSLDSVTRHYAQLSYINFETAQMFSRYMVVFDPNDDVGVLRSANLDVPDLISDFEADVLSGDAPLTVNFTDLSQGILMDWDWDFGDVTTHSYIQNPTHIYTNPGIYTVSLEINSEYGQTDTETKINYIVAIGYHLESYFKADVVSGDAPLTVNFTDLSLGTPIDWYWDFGDGTTSVLQNPTHTYDNPGIYTVSLEINSADEQNSKRIRNNYITVKQSGRPQWVQGYPVVGAIYDREFDVFLKMDKDVRCYFVILPVGSETPTPEQIIAGTDAFGVKVNVKEKGSVLLTAYKEKRITVPYLIQETTYNIYLTGKP